MWDMYVKFMYHYFLFLFNCLINALVKQLTEIIQGYLDAHLSDDLCLLHTKLMELNGYSVSFFIMWLLVIFCRLQGNNSCN